MKLESIQIKNYKSFDNSERICFHDAFNVLAGKNNVGKTALIEVIYKALLGVNDVPSSKGTYGGNGIIQSTPVLIELVIKLSSEEMNEYITKFCKQVYGDLLLVKLKSWQGITSILQISEFSDEAGDVLIEWRDDTYHYWDDEYHKAKSKGIPDWLSQFYEKLKSSFLFISGSRSVSINQPIVDTMNLDISATNFHSFMQTLHNNKEEVFDLIQDSFIKIFPDVLVIRTPIIGITTNVHLDFKGINNTIPLQECGSGFIHILIFLCVLYSESNKIVLYDEPHIYLHPSAEKAIYDLASKHKSHQFIFTTHSPILINYPTSKYLYLVTKDEESKSVTSLMETVNIILNEIGISNSDFALADKILFVEGETEENVLPLILASFNMEQIGYNYKIFKMQTTGSDFSKKSAMSNNSQKISQIFGGLSSSPIPYKILIDRDEKNEGKITELNKMYGENILILERRELENYFLHCFEPILLCLENLESDVNINDIEVFINDCYLNINDRKLFPKEKTNHINDIVGSEVLERLFNHYKQSYNKIRHGVFIVKWLLENKPEVLEPISDLLKPFISQK